MQRSATIVRPKHSATESNPMMSFGLTDRSSCRSNLRLSLYVHHSMEHKHSTPHSGPCQFGPQRSATKSARKVFYEIYADRL